MNTSSRLKTQVLALLLLASSPTAPQLARARASQPAATGAVIIRRIVPGGPNTAPHALEALPSPWRVTTSDGWRLNNLLPPRTSQPVGAQSTNRHSFAAMAIQPGIRRQWDVAVPPSSETAVPTTRKEAWAAVHRKLADWRANGDLTAMGIDYAEPDLVISAKEDKRRASRAYSIRRAAAAAPGPADNRPREIHVGTSQSSHWPTRDEFAWHLGADFSQLGQARERVHTTGAWTNHVKVILLDTGVHTDYAGVPEDFDAAASTNLYDNPSSFSGWNLHGTSTTSILAGGRVRGTMKEFFPKAPDGHIDDYLGAAPWADVITFRIHDSVVHIASSYMADGIRLATEKKADVVSISHGGVPLLSWAEAVDFAYENGTAIFAASGDYLNFIFGHSPRRIVYPAAFDRVMCVPGVTASYKSYGRPNSFWEIFDWGQMRGSYGPVFEMNNAVCGFSPNIPWSGTNTNIIDLDGGGTSAATPQVAAAAALWLQMHHYDGDLTKDAIWRSPRKVNAVYYALKSTARRNHLPDNADPYYFGSGTIAASDALDVPFSLNRPPYDKADLELANLLDLLTDWIGPSFFLSGVTGTPEDKSFQHEALQVALESPEVQSMIENMQAPNLTPAQQKKVRQIIARSKISSEPLKQRMIMKGPNS